MKDKETLDGWLTVTQYAKLRGLSRQNVQYRINTKNLEVKWVGNLQLIRVYKGEISI